MDAFDDGFGNGEEVDPAAEFLAKEQEELGDIGEDLGLGTHPEAGDRIEAFKEEFEPEIPVVPSGGGADYSAFGDVQEELSGGMGGMTIGREEPECLKNWKLKQDQMLKEKDANEEIKKEELRAKAAQELADWYKQYEEQLEKNRKANKEHEKAQEVPEVNGIVPGQEWERVSKHCDFSAKAPGHTKDVSRMRSILLQLKQNPPAVSRD